MVADTATALGIYFGTMAVLALCFHRWWGK